MTNPVRLAMSARVPTSEHSLFGDAQILNISTRIEGGCGFEASSGAAPAKHELPVSTERLESELREIHPRILRIGSHFRGS